MIENDLDPPMTDEVPVNVRVVTNFQTVAPRQCSSDDLPDVPVSVSNSNAVPLNVIDHFADDLVDVLLMS